jgi:hypothetical protein
VFARIISAPQATSSSGVTPFTVPYVPTGMKAGVSTAPRANERRARARRPVAGKKLELHTALSRGSSADGSGVTNMASP